MSLLHLKLPLKHSSLICPRIYTYGGIFTSRSSSSARDHFRQEKKLEESLHFKTENDIPKIRNISYISNSVLQLPNHKGASQSKPSVDVYQRIALYQKRNLQFLGNAPLSQAKPSGGSSEVPPPPNERKGLSKESLIVIFCSFIATSIAVKYIFEDKDKPEDTPPPAEQPKIMCIPQSSSEIPDEIPYLLIGGGTASFAAFRAIKTSDPYAKILVISNEPYHPYMRPPLSKEMFYSEDQSHVKSLKFKQWNGTTRSIFYEPDEFYIPCKSLMESENGGIAIALGWHIKALDPTRKIAYLNDGKQIKYSKCLLATGSRPKIPPVFENVDKKVAEKINFYRGVCDFEKLEDVLEKGASSIVIVGNGFLGSELSCAIARKSKKNNIRVTQVFSEDQVMSRVLPKYLCEWTMEKVIKEGVSVRAKCDVTSIVAEGGRAKVMLSDGESIVADQVIVASGAEPVTDLAESSQLETDPQLGGFLVNAELSARSDLYAAGDCACFFDVDLGRRRVEHHDHAVVSGRLAGENMAGAHKVYNHQSMFWSDIGSEIGFEAIGIIDSSLPTVGVYMKNESTSEEPVAVHENLPTSTKTNSKENYDKGVIFYLKNDIVVGIILWNLFNKMETARLILKEKRKFDDLNEVAKLFNIYGIKDKENSVDLSVTS